ncbi:MAG: serine hydrolase domain-containing protein [Pirellulales bacterium]
MKCKGASANRGAFLALLALGFALHETVAATPADTDARRAAVAEAITAAMQKHAVPGVSIAVVNDYKIDWAQGFGVLKAGEDQPVSPTTLFQAASVSKPVAALVALRTVQLGKLTLDEDVDRRLLSWHFPPSQLLIKPITLRHLLSHSAGLTVHGFPGYDVDAAQPTLVQILSGSPPANTEPVKLLVKPGYMWKYSGGGYTVMQQLLLDVTGVPFPDYARQQVLEPLGMSHSTYEQPLPTARTAEAANGHTAGAKPMHGGWVIHPEMAAAGLWTTPSDLALVVIDVAGTISGRTGKILSGGMAAEMLKVQSGSYGLGFALNGTSRGFRFSHGGSNEGFRCVLIGLPATGQGVIIMTNSDSGGALLQQIVPVVEKIYEWPAP